MLDMFAENPFKDEEIAVPAPVAVASEPVEEEESVTVADMLEDGSLDLVLLAANLLGWTEVTYDEKNEVIVGVPPEKAGSKAKNRFETLPDYRNDDLAALDFVEDEDLFPNCEWNDFRDLNGDHTITIVKVDPENKKKQILAQCKGPNRACAIAFASFKASGFAKSANILGL